MLEMVAMVAMLSHRNKDEDSTEAENCGENKYKGNTSVDDEEETEVEVNFSDFQVETEKAEEALGADKKGEVDDVKLIQASENILLDVGDGAVVDTEDAASGDTKQDTDDRYCSSEYL